LYRKNEAKGYDYTDYGVDILYNDEALASFNYAEFGSIILRLAFTRAYIDRYCGFGKARLTNDDVTMIIISAILSVISLTLLIVMMRLCLKRRKELKKAADDSILVTN
jgi:hypothetical protein